MMVQDHTRANQALMQNATRYGMSPPTTLPPSAQAAQRVLQQASGPEFDRQYLDQQMSGHVMQRALFQSAASGARNQDIRSFAQRTLTVIDRHIDELRRI